MRYLCAVYVDRELAAAASEAEWKEVQRQCLDYIEELKRSGHYITSNALAEPDTATTLRRRAGVLARSDGPFAETKEHLGGFLLLEARDLNEAIQIAERNPMTQMGAVEVRITAGF